MFEKNKIAALSKNLNWFTRSRCKIISAKPLGLADITNLL